MAPSRWTVTQHPLYMSYRSFVFTSTDLPFLTFFGKPSFPSSLPHCSCGTAAPGSPLEKWVWPHPLRPARDSVILAFPCQQPSATPTLGTLSCEGLLLSARQSCHWAQPACSARSQPQEKQLWPCPPLSAPVLVATVFFDHSELYCSSVWACCCHRENTLLWVLSPSTTGQVRNTGPGFQLPGGSSVPPACVRAMRAHHRTTPAP